MKRRAKAVAVPYQLMRVQWEDSARPVAEWQWTDDYEVPKIVTCISVGYLISKSRQALALAPNLGEVGRERVQASGIIRIPQSAVRLLSVLS